MQDRVAAAAGSFGQFLMVPIEGLLITVLAGIVIFGVPFEGSVILLAVMTLLFLSGALGLGIFISAVLKSQVLATQVAMVVTYLPTLLLSGFMFSIDSMPAPLRAVSYLLPARYFLVVTRGVFLKGVGVEVLVTTAGVVGLGVLGLSQSAPPKDAPPVKEPVPAAPKPLVRPRGPWDVADVERAFAARLNGLDEDERRALTVVAALESGPVTTALAAFDRLEAGMPLYGHELTEQMLDVSRPRTTAVARCARATSTCRPSRCGASKDSSRWRSMTRSTSSQS